jgi:excinuclease ABC subunit C
VLAKRIAQAPHAPGVYVWRDRAGHPLYIGKAADLRNRLANYRKPADPRIRLMVSESYTLRWQELSNDIEALIVESQMIKRLHPKYNISMRDNKQYFFVAVTDEDFPQFILTHQAASSKIKKPIKELIGPFTEGVPLKATLRVLRNLFPYCTCKSKHHIRCLNAHIGKCPGFCCLKTPATAPQKSEYRRNIRAIKDILTGKRDTVIRKLESRMKAAGQAHDLEQALSLQHRIERVRRVFENARVNASRQLLAGRHHQALKMLAEEFGLAAEPSRIEGYDIANIQGQHANGAMVVFQDGRADNAEYRLFNIRSVGQANDTAMLRETLQRRLNHPEWRLPELIIVDGGKAQLNAIQKELAEKELTIPVIALTKNDRHQGDHVSSSLDSRVRYLKDLPGPLANLILHVDAEAHRFAIKQYRRRHGRALISE